MILFVTVMLTLVVGVSLGWLVGRRRSLPRLRPGQRVVFVHPDGRTAADMVLESYTVGFNSPARIELVSREAHLQRIQLQR